MKLSKKELLDIYAGAVSATFINAVVKGILIIIELGKSLGSSIRRVSTNNSCEIQ